MMGDKKVNVKHKKTAGATLQVTYIESIPELRPSFFSDLSNRGHPAYLFRASKPKSSPLLVPFSFRQMDHNPNLLFRPDYL
jgi:hypothetical protein